MLRWKLHPHHLQAGNAFTDLPDRLRSSLADLVGSMEAEIVLANSASYGLHLIANGLRLGDGDDVIVAANDFPSDILPRLLLEPSGVSINRLHPNGEIPTTYEIAAALTDRTRVVCLPWVHSFSGQVIDLDAIGSICRDAGALLVVNGSQGVGAIPINVSEPPIDALISVGFKWLCGPYGTGFCWIGPRAEEQLAPSQLYWLNVLRPEDLEQGAIDYSALQPGDVGRHDIFGTANFFNFAAFAESVHLIRQTGVGLIHEHDLAMAGTWLSPSIRSGTKSSAEVTQIGIPASSSCDQPVRRSRMWLIASNRRGSTSHSAVDSSEFLLISTTRSMRSIGWSPH